MCLYSGGVLVTTTNEWVSGSSEQVCVVSRGLTSTVTVLIRIQQTQYRDRGDPVTYSQASLDLPAGRSHTPPPRDVPRRSYWLCKEVVIGEL